MTEEEGQESQNTPIEDPFSETESKPTVIDGVEALQPDMDDMTNFLLWSFDFAAGDVDVQDTYFEWCAAKGYFEDITVDSVDNFIDDRRIVPPVDHPNIDSIERDVLETKMRLKAAIMSKSILSGREDEKLHDLLPRIVQKDSRDIALGNRTGRRESKKGTRDNSRADKYNSTVRRLFLDENKGKHRVNHRIHDSFAQEFRNVVSEFRPLLKKTSSYTSEDLDLYYKLENKYGQEFFDTFLPGMQILVSTWENHHEGQSYFSD